MTAWRAAGWAAAHAAVVTGLMLLLGHPVPGPYGVVGLAVLAAVAVAAWAWGRRWPAAALLLATAGAVAVEVALPGPDVAVLGSERVTTGLAVLDRHVAVWPLVLVLMLLVGGVEHERSTDRASWARTLAVAAGAGVLVSGSVLVAGLGRGWVTGAPFWLWYTLPWLFGLGVVVASTVLRWHLVAPASVFGIALAVAVVTAWVLPIGDPVAGLSASSLLWLAIALIAALVEVLGRARVRRVLGDPSTV